METEEEEDGGGEVGEGESVTSEEVLSWTVAVVSADVYVPPYAVGTKREKMKMTKRHPQYSPT